MERKWLSCKQAPPVAGGLPSCRPPDGRPPPRTCARRLVPPGVQIALLGHRRHCSAGACCRAGQAENGAGSCLAGAPNSRSRQFAES